MLNFAREARERPAKYRNCALRGEKRYRFFLVCTHTRARARIPDRRAERRFTQSDIKIPFSRSLRRLARKARTENVSRSRVTLPRTRKFPLPHVSRASTKTILPQHVFQNVTDLIDTILNSRMTPHYKLHLYAVFALRAMRYIVTSVLHFDRSYHIRSLICSVFILKFLSFGERKCSFSRGEFL